MRVLILSITAGQGHNQTAKSICDYLQYMGMDCMTLDTLEYINPVLMEVVSKGYLLSTKRIPKIYGEFYRIAEKRDKENKKSKFVKLSTAVLSRKLSKFIEDYRPDVIVCTHIFAAMLINDVAEKIDRSIKTVGIVTDFTIHPFWEYSDLDCYITASELLTNQMIKKGIAPSKVYPIGIPIHPKFKTRTDKTEAKELLGLENKPTVLVMSGSMGYGKVGKVIKELDKSELDFQIVSICGNNERQKRTIDKMDLSRSIYNYGFTNKVDLFMDAADCIVTKPGGLTTSEALAKGLPIIMVNPIPGQEDRNEEFLLNNGAALKVSKTMPIDDVIYQLFANETRLKILRETIASLGKPTATADFAKLIGGIKE